MVILETVFDFVMLYVLATWNIMIGFSTWVGCWMNTDVIALVYMETGLNLKCDWLVYQE